jgi:putative phosphoribosyl transferase
MRFADRNQAGALLAERLRRFATAQPIVLGLARGGIPIGFPIALALKAPLGIVLVRKIGVPWQRELALGAIVGGALDERIIDEAMVRSLGVSPAYVDAEIARQGAEIERRRRLYGSGTPLVLEGKTAIVVDDGIATGASMRVALGAVRRRAPARLVLAVPVAAADSLETLRNEADDIVCLHAPEDFVAVGAYYDDFHNVEDGEVIALLEKARRS